MLKKNKINSLKLIQYYKLINYNLIYNNKAINRYNKDNYEISEDKSKRLELLKKSITNLKNCNLKKNAKNIVFSDGNPKSKIMLIGEAPGANEDQEGLPFVGRAGQLLDKMLSSINLDRKKVYISNIINYRPPDNRRPSEEEIKRYLPFILKHIEIIQPKILVLLGSTAMNALIGNDVVISKMRGKWIEKNFGSCKTSVIITFHPAFLMRQPAQKKMAWIDLKMIRDKKTNLKIWLKELITAGVDEVGRGCLAGPVVSAAVILKKGINLNLLKDSKKISFKKRKVISDHIKNNSYFAIGIASVEEIFNLNILQASLLSMSRAIEQLVVKPDLTLIDGNFAPTGLKNYKTIINGDEKIKVISAASIIAKVYRDKLMINLAEEFSNYSWERNFGYGTKAHLEGLKKFGITLHHRKRFKPVHKILSN